MSADGRDLDICADWPPTLLADVPPTSWCVRPPGHRMPHRDRDGMEWRPRPEAGVPTMREARQQKPPPPFAAVALLALAAGILAAVWLHRWEWAVTGLVVCVVGLVVGAAVEGRRLREAGR